MSASLLETLFSAFLSKVRARGGSGRGDCSRSPTAPQKIAICGSRGVGESRLQEHLAEQGLHFNRRILQLVYSGKLPGRVTSKYGGLWRVLGPRELATSPRARWPCAISHGCFSFRYFSESFPGVTSASGPPPPATPMAQSQENRPPGGQGSATTWSEVASEGAPWPARPGRSRAPAALGAPPLRETQAPPGRSKGTGSDHGTGRSQSRSQSLVNSRDHRPTVTLRTSLVPWVPFSIRYWKAPEKLHRMKSGSCNSTRSCN